MKLKQITRWTQQDAQRYIITVLVGYPNPNVVTAVWVLMDFCYLAQALVIHIFHYPQQDFYHIGWLSWSQAFNSWAGPPLWWKNWYASWLLQHSKVRAYASHSLQYQQCWKYYLMDCRHDRTCLYWSCEGSYCYDQQHELWSVMIHSYLFFFGLIFLLYNYSSLPHHQPADHTCLCNRFLPSNSSYFYDSPLLTHIYFFVIPLHSIMFCLFLLCSRTFWVSGI